MKKLDNKLLYEFKYTTKELFPRWYKIDKKFKLILGERYPTTTLRRPYLYMVDILYMLYGEQDASHFSLSCMPLIHYFMDEGLSFNWDGILLANLAEAITTVVEAQSRIFPSFHMSSYLMDIMCISHQYPNMGWK
jgi:hypothetical protein